MLIKELIKLNDFLPSNAYIPFTTAQMRHYVVLHIPPQEAYVFKTKSRAPFMITVEMYQPFEFAFANNTNDTGTIDAIIAKKISKEITIDRIISGMEGEDSNNVTGYIKQLQEAHSKQDVPIPRSLRNEIGKGDTNISKARRVSIEETKTRALSNGDGSESLATLYSGDTITDITPQASLKLNDKIKIIQKINPFGEAYESQVQRLRKASPYGRLETWRVFKFIVKTNDNLLQEQFAMQLIMQFKYIFQQKFLNLWVFPYEIICTGPDSGLIECINDIVTIDSLLKKCKPANITTLSEFFEIFFTTNASLQSARECFAHSLAAYSLICYILQVRDRHNANILVDRQGHLIHIDFGFLISNNPGNFELDNAPFKLPADWIDVMGGIDSIYFKMFVDDMVDGFTAIQACFNKIQVLIEAMYNLHEDLPCFQGKLKAIQGVASRIFPQIAGRTKRRALNSIEAKNFIDQLIGRANNNFRARVYDAYQYCFQGIY